MTGNVNVSGTYKTIAAIFANVSGTWKTVSTAYVNVAGTWKTWFTAGGGVDPITLSGTLSATGSGTTVTSSTRTVTVPGGNSGQVRFNNVTNDGSGQDYSKNGGAFTNFSEDSTVVFSNGDTIAIRATGMLVADSLIFDLVDDDSDGNIEATVTLTRF